MSFWWVVGGPGTATRGSTTVTLRYTIGLSCCCWSPPLLPLPLPPQDSTGHSLHHHLATSHNTTTISLSPLPRVLSLSRVLPAGSFFTLRNRALFPALPKPYDPFTPGYLPSSTPQLRGGWGGGFSNLTLPVLSFFFSGFLALWSILQHLACQESVRS